MRNLQFISDSDTRKDCENIHGNKNIPALNDTQYVTLLFSLSCNLLAYMNTVLSASILRNCCCYSNDFITTITKIKVLVTWVIGLLSGDSISTVESFDPIAGQWKLAEPMSTLRSRVGIAVLQGTSIYTQLEGFEIHAQCWLASVDLLSAYLSCRV